MDGYVLDLREIDRTRVPAVGGKGAHLGELSRVEGVRVPAGFCVTTDAFRRVMEGAPSINDRLDRLSRLDPEDREAIRTRGAEIRRTIEGTAFPDDVAAAIHRALLRFGERTAYAVRSSATTEDSPEASFAGQQDTYPNVVGPEAVLRHVRLCWASLFTERAVTYRLRNGFDQRKARMAVVVQRMVLPQAAGVLFTADPVTSDRTVTCVEAVPGLGEALVSGLVNPDVHRVRDDEVIAGAIATKPLAVHASPEGGTRRQPIAPARQREPALTDAQVVRLARLGRRIEAHFGCPLDIEWCLADDDFLIVQSRPITTLFPVPEAADRANRVYVSVGHQQMMTDPLKPLGLSLWQMTTPRPMCEAGGRLFVDVTPRLAAPTSRAHLLEALGSSDPLIRDALETVLERGDFIRPLPDENPDEPTPTGAPAPIETDPAVVTGLIARTRASLATLKQDIRTKSGEELFDFIRADVRELRRLLFDPLGLRVITAGTEATRWLNERLEEWLGERNAADTLARSVPHNITSEMGLALLDVADVIRPRPEVVAFLREVGDEDFLEGMAGLDGGREAREAITAYLETYGMRCVGEIDITAPRWSERPTTLLPMLLSHIENLEPGAGGRRLERGRQEARRKEEDLLKRLRALPGGERKAEETGRMIDRLRTFVGYREYPKYGMVSRYSVYKRALLREAERLVRDGVLREREDIFFLRFRELHDVVRTNRVDDELIRHRRAGFRAHQALTPPRVLTSDGEVLSGTYRRHGLPAGALVGLPASAGTVEGRARVLHDLAEADPEPGDLLVTTHTDPAWSPLFVAVAGVVTEVGGLMTHGAVVAREYGLPAVVGVEHATRLIRDGQRIRVNGTDGCVELLPGT
ncbi:rifamycin-inactivating phosphotransferase [Streptomyces alkaliphilus]|uniref:rifamycin-inactivating phosphotransferase n=1 Tax=Streptomyces alkaliphilus TaxID=1472722 RepID=UPI00117BF88B|nr:rifamycin-inactivating phosphotransferase [Streptomyces alkaliphilus]MQS06662.1 phosphoenolpyruvate synthase [Streptomyces alkaliphilus]